MPDAPRLGASGSVALDAAQNLMLLSGSVPGPKGAVVEVRSDA